MYYIVEVDDGQIKLIDSDGNIVTTTDLGSGKRGLDVNIPNASLFVLRDGTVATRLAKIDEAGNVMVKISPDAPPNTIPVDYYIKGNVAGSSNSDTPYIIPANTTMVLQRFIGGAFPYSTNTSALQLSYDNSGTITTNSFLISFAYYLNQMYIEDLTGEYTGNGTQAIIMRRSRLDAIARDMYSRLKGYLRYNTYTLNDSGNSTSATASTMTDTSKSWTVNAHAGRYLIMNNNTPLKIISNTATVLTIASGHVINRLGVNPYQIVTFNA